MSRPDRTPKKRTPEQQAEVVAGYAANHIQNLANGNITEHSIRNALIGIQKVLGNKATFIDAANALKSALPAGPHLVGHVPLDTTRIDNMASLLAQKNAQATTELTADLDIAIRNADALLAQHAKLQAELTTLQTKTAPTSDETIRIAALQLHINKASSTIKQATAATKSAKEVLEELPTSAHPTPTLTRAKTSYAAQSEGKDQLEKLKTAYKNATTKQYRQTNELFATLGGGVPLQIDTSVIAPLKAQTTDDATQKIYDTIKTKIDTINKKLEELHKLQAELAVPNGAASEKDIEKHQKLLNDIAEENTKLAKMFKDAQDLLGAHAELAGQSEKLEQLTVQLRAISDEKKMPILGNATLELTKNELDQKFKCGTRTWNKMEKKWDTKQLNVNPTRTDIETFVTNWNASLAEWNKANPYDQRKPITLKGNPPHTMACGDEENRNKVEPVFCRAMQDAEKARATATATATTSPVPAAQTPGGAAPT